MFDLAIIGGLGPEATVELYRRIVQYTDAGRDQEHMKIIILNDSKVPDRTRYILDGNTKPIPQVLEDIRIAVNVGCRYFILPCNTIHAFQEDFKHIEGIGFISMVDETLLYIQQQGEAANVCILGTNGMIFADVYKKSHVADGLNIIYPNPDTQNQVMDIITTIKSGEYDKEQLAENMEQMLNCEFDMGNTVFVLACTELSLLYNSLKGGTYIDAMDALAVQTVKICGYKVRWKTCPLKGGEK